MSASLAPVVLAGPRAGGLLPGHPAFDRVLIFGVLAVALGLGALASVSPALLIAVVWVDIWLFANPHLVATYTRIGVGSGALRRHRFLVFGLPLVVLVAVATVALAYEVPGLFALYFIAQTYHVARQSMGIARAYRRAGGSPAEPDRLSEALIYLVPGWGLLARCAQAPEAFLGYPITLPAVPGAWADAVGAAALLCGLAWLWRLACALRAGRADGRHAAFVASHVLVSLVAFGAATDITLGWLVFNIWHNLQYLLFVWAQNVRRDQRGPNGLWAHAARYAAVCGLLGSAIFFAVEWWGAQWLWLGWPTVLIAHFTLNFHHYLVDGVIWKRRHLAREAQVQRTGKAV